MTLYPSMTTTVSVSELRVTDRALTSATGKTNRELESINRTTTQIEHLLTAAVILLCVLVVFSAAKGRRTK